MASDTDTFAIGDVVEIDGNHMAINIPAGVRGKIISGPIAIYPGTVHEDKCYAVHLAVDDRLRLSAGGSIGNLLIPARAIKTLAEGA